MMKARHCLILGTLIVMSCSPARDPSSANPDERYAPFSPDRNQSVQAEPTGEEHSGQIRSDEGLLDARVSDSVTSTAPVLVYDIIRIEDVSFANVKRYSVRVRVEKVLSRDELDVLSMRIIEDLRMTRAHNAIAIFFYLPDSDPKGLYTAGKAEWAPFGDWGNADQVRTGDYTKHKLQLSVGNATGIDPDEVRVSGLSTELKKEVFFDLVEAQDRGAGNRAYGIVASRHGLTEDTVRKIALEGQAQGWPMP
ncbi:MAG: hypothetical protein QM570_15300 [Planctomycetota bacterium]|jgi:hypothetical protein|nr:hypothetical protein [Planctomycetota bacterium]